MTQEEKAKAYDDLLVKLQKAKVDNNVCDERYCCVIDDIVPELIEGEDERIRKNCIHFPELQKQHHAATFEIEECIACLEKQCEKGTNGNERDFPISEPPLTLKHAKEVMGIKQDDAWSEKDEKFFHGLIRGLSAKRDIHGHTTFSSDCIDITETINWLESLKNRVLLYPVSVEYNEEDIDNIADMFIPEPVWNVLEESEGEGSNAAAYDYSQMIAMFKAGVHWLKSIKNRVQPQQEWSEEDETGLGDTLWAIKQARTIAKDENDMGNLWYAEHWLQSLKERVQPQPQPDERNRLLGILEKWLDEYVSDLADVSTDILIRSFENYLDGKLQAPLKYKVQPKQEWKQENVGDLTDFEHVMMHIGASFFGQHAGLDPNDTNTIKEQANLLLELVPRKEWSKEDRDYYDAIITKLEITQDDASLTDNQMKFLKSLKDRYTWNPSKLPHWKKSTLPNDNTTGFNSDYFCHNGYCINYKELFEKLPKDD